MAELQPGLVGEESYTTGPQHSAKHFGAAVDVYGTPMLVGLMETAAINAVVASLPEGSASVGTSMSFKHTAATPLGASVRARAELVEVDGRRLVFRVEAFDDWEQIGSGEHERFVVEVGRFMSRLENKAAGQKNG
ncbi:hypothetical protein AYO38_06705 [bacterium SCGC AG-212-C10]|nr:hypothetical protein AYO38_06705 [bacterium SCGC AG-212-C10]